MRWLGGVPVDRSAASGFVEETARVVRESARMTLVVAPDTQASLLVLRPREGGVLDASSVDLEAVFIDGREPGGSR
jgi:hypothetical protein